MENDGYSSPEISRALQEAGFTAPHTHVWAQFFDGYAKDNTKTMLIKKVDLFPGQIHYPAYRFEQVWVMLPPVIQHYDLRLFQTGDNKQSICEYSYAQNHNDCLAYEKHPSPVEAVCQLILWCIENGYIKI